MNKREAARIGWRMGRMSKTCDEVYWDGVDYAIQAVFDAMKDEDDNAAKVFMAAASAGMNDDSWEQVHTRIVHGPDA